MQLCSAMLVCKEKLKTSGDTLAERGDEQGRKDTSHIYWVDLHAPSSGDTWQDETRDLVKHWAGKENNKKQMNISKGHPPRKNKTRLYYMLRATDELS